MIKGVFNYLFSGQQSRETTLYQNYVFQKKYCIQNTYA
jgi:hypothetical protein